MSGPLIASRIAKSSARLVDSNTAYGKRMARLSNRIFGEVSTTTDQTSLRVVEIMAAEPWEQRDDKSVKYYPNLPMFHYLTKLLRLHGVYFDDHVIWRQLQDELRLLEGKVVRPVIGAGKHAQLRKTKK